MFSADAAPHRPSAPTRPPPRAESPLPYREPSPAPAAVAFAPAAPEAHDYTGPEATSPAHSDGYDNSMFTASNASTDCTSSGDSAGSDKSSVSAPRKRVKRETHHEMTVDEFKSSRLMRGMTNCSGEVLLSALKRLTGMLEKSVRPDFRRISCCPRPKS